MNTVTFVAALPRNRIRVEWRKPIFAPRKQRGLSIGETDSLRAKNIARAYGWTLVVTPAGLSWK